MCSDCGADSSEDYDSSESTEDVNDLNSELCEDSSETNESEYELTENNEDSSESELVENSSEKTEPAEKEDGSEAENDKEEKSDTSDSEVDSEAVRAEINEKSEYSDEVNEKISSVEELEIYQNVNLKEENIDGRVCLVRDNIEMDYVDSKSGMTNQELMEKGRAPYDAKTGERIELHHIGQDFDSPLAELTEDSEHGQYYSALHTKEGESWRNDSEKNNRYNNVERPGHWKARAKGAD